MSDEAQTTLEESAKDAIEDAEDAIVTDTEEAVTDASPAPARSRPGYVPLLAGGLVAGAIGFASGYYLDWIGNDNLDDLMGTLQTQSDQIEALSAQTASLESQLAGLEPPEVDLSGIEAELADLGSGLSEASASMTGLDDRLSAVEARPIFTGDAAADEAALTAAIDQLRADLMSQQEENAVMAEDIATMAEDAQARIAQAEARAADAATTASAQASLSALRIAIASGTPFADPLAQVAEAYSLDVPAEIQSAAETGIPTLAEVEAAYPAAARAALPVAMRASVAEDEGAGGRLNAFLRSQLGGRSLEPREGSDPDAILSRAGAAVAAGDLPTALDEIGALPEPAQEVLADWTELANTRLVALDALDGLSATLGN